MTLGGKDGEGGINIQWPLVAVFATVLISIVTGAIQLGAVQTRVQVNTGRLDQLELHEREHAIAFNEIRERTTRVEQIHLGIQKRLDSLEARGIRAVDEISERHRRFDERLDNIEKALAAHRSRSSYDNPATSYDDYPTNGRLKQKSPP